MVSWNFNPHSGPFRAPASLQGLASWTSWQWLLEELYWWNSQVPASWNSTIGFAGCAACFQWLSCKGVSIEVTKGWTCTCLWKKTSLLSLVCLTDPNGEPQQRGWIHHVSWQIRSSSRPSGWGTTMLAALRGPKFIPILLTYRLSAVGGSPRPRKRNFT